jgi:hypothetical protein
MYCSTKLSFLKKIFNLMVTAALLGGLLAGCGGGKNGCQYQIIKATGQITCVPPMNAGK